MDHDVVGLEIAEPVEPQHEERPGRIEGSGGSFPGTLRGLWKAVLQNPALTKPYFHVHRIDNLAAERADAFRIRRGTGCPTPDVRDPVGGECQNLYRVTDGSGTTPKVTLTYKFDDQRLVYATYSEGFRPGGFNRGTGVIT